MVRIFFCIAWICFLATPACGQQTLVLPEATAGGACGEGYPPSDEGDGGIPYALEEGAVFPCLLFESVKRGGEETYLHFPDIYLEG